MKQYTVSVDQINFSRSKNWFTEVASAANTPHGEGERGGRRFDAIGVGRTTPSMWGARRDIGLR